MPGNQLRALGIMVVVLAWMVHTWLLSHKHARYSPVATLCLPGNLCRWALERRLWDALVVFLIILSAVMATGLSWWNSSAPSQRGHFSRSAFPLLILGSVWLVPAISFHPKKQGQYFPKSPETALCPFCLFVCLFCMLIKVRPGPWWRN